MSVHGKGPEKTQVEKVQSQGKDGAPDNRGDMDSSLRRRDEVFGAGVFMPLLGF